jgi:hypothetical protein
VFNGTLDGTAFEMDAHGYAVNYDGAGPNDYSTLTAQASVGLADYRGTHPDYALGIWFRNDAGGERMIIHQRSSGGPNGSTALKFDASSQVEFSIYNTSNGFIATSPLAYNDGLWHHALGQRVNSTTGDLYIDGELVVSSSSTARELLSVVTSIGRFITGSQYWNGSLGAMVKYNRSLTPHEIRILASDPYATVRPARKQIPRITLAGGATTGDVAFDLPLLWMNNPQVLALPILTVQGGSGATGAITLPALSVAATTPGVGGPTIVGNGDITLPMLFVGTANQGAFSLPAFSVSAEQVQHVDFDVNLPKFVITGHAMQGVVHNVSINLPILSIVARAGANGTITLPSLTFNTQGHNGLVGNLDKVLPSLSVVVKATQPAIVTANLNLPMFDTDFSGLQGNISVSGSNRILPLLQVNASAAFGFVGTSSISFPVLELAASGYDNPRGTFSQELKQLTFDAFADIHINRII